MRALRIFFMVLGIISFTLLMFGLLMPKNWTITRKRIAILKVEGIIDDPDRYVDILEDLKNNRSVKAIVLRVNSPGGIVGACQEIHDKIAEVKKKKPVVVSMGSIATSGALYISVSATKIVAEPGTITGSIGVILQSYNLEKLAEKLGVKVITVKSGKFKDILNPFREPEKEDIKVLESLIEDSYMQFVEAVAKGRGLSVDRVKEFADGRIFTGKKAKELGLVDELGGLSRALDLARRLSGAQDAKPFEVKREMPLIYRIFGEDTGSIVKIFSRILRGDLQKITLMYAY